MSSDEISDMLGNISSEVHRMIDTYADDQANAFRADFNSLMRQYQLKDLTQTLPGISSAYRKFRPDTTEQDRKDAELNLLLEQRRAAKAAARQADD